jgi:hypothetical protein
MPIYYVYNVNTGVIVHRHEHSDATSGDSMACSKEDVLSLVDPAHRKDDLDVLEVEPVAEGEQVERALRVDLKTRELVINE